MQLHTGARLPLFEGLEVVEPNLEPCGPTVTVIMIFLLPGLVLSCCASEFYFVYGLVILYLYDQLLIIYSSLTTRCDIYTLLSNGNRGTEGLISLPQAHN